MRDLIEMYWRWLKLHPTWIHSMNFTYDIEKKQSLTFKEF